MICHVIWQILRCISHSKTNRFILLENVCKRGRVKSLRTEARMFLQEIFLQSAAIKNDLSPGTREVAAFYSLIQRQLFREL